MTVLELRTQRISPQPVLVATASTTRSVSTRLKDRARDTWQTMAPMPFTRCVIDANVMEETEHGAR